MGKYSIRMEEKNVLVKGLLDEIKRIYTEIYSESFDECLDGGSIEQYELCTDKDHNCFMLLKGSAYLQDFACDERVAALVNAYNTIIGGKPSIVIFQKK